MSKCPRHWYIIKAQLNTVNNVKYFSEASVTADLTYSVRVHLINIHNLCITPLASIKNNPVDD